MRSTVLSLAVLLSSTGLFTASGQNLVPMFDGKTLNGWKVCNGYAKYVVEDGTIVGTTAEGSPNSFLCSEKEYGDFILEYETRTDPALNSGVQIRAHQYAKDVKVKTFNGKQIVERQQKAGRVYGYQVETATAKTGASGGVYDEARRGWLHNISSDPVASKAFKDDQWNHYRVVAKGDSIKVFINGVACADLVDPMDQSGFIGLQVHGYKGEKPAQVRWRNVRIADLGRHEWKPVWDGKSLKGWTKKGNGTWTIENGAIHGKTTPGDANGSFLISDRSFKDVTARVRFKMVKGNSGFFVRAKKDNLAGYEVEIDDTTRTGGLWEVGGRKWVTGPEDNSAVLKDDWNELTASMHGRRIVFHLNGTKTVEIANDAGGSLEGHLALQIHGIKRETEILFKDIAVLEPAGR